MGKGEKKGTTLKVVTGQGSSFEGEERKGVRKSEKGRKQTTLISHLPPSPTRDTPPVPSRIHFPSQGLLHLNFIYPFPSYFKWFPYWIENTFHWPAQLFPSTILGLRAVWHLGCYLFTVFLSVYLHDLIFTPYHPLINCCRLYPVLKHVDSRGVHFYEYTSSLDKCDLTCKRRHNLLDRSIPSEVQGAGSTSSLLKR